MHTTAYKYYFIWCGFLRNCAAVWHCVALAALRRVSDTSSIDHLVMREFVSGPPRYHLPIMGICEHFVVLEQSSGL